MSIIDKLVEFKPKTKALATEVNYNFEQLRLSNNQLDNSVNKLRQDFENYQENALSEIECEEDTLELNANTNNYKISEILASMLLKTVLQKKLITLHQKKKIRTYSRHKLLLMRQEIKTARQIF